MRINLTETEILNGIVFYLRTMGMQIEATELEAQFTAGRKGSGVSLELNFPSPEPSIHHRPVHVVVDDIVVTSALTQEAEQEQDAPEQEAEEEDQTPPFKLAKADKAIAEDEDEAEEEAFAEPEETEADVEEDAEETAEEEAEDPAPVKRKSIFAKKP